MNDYVISIENAEVNIKDFSLKADNIHIEPGYIIGIEGDNGAGKTTFLKMLSGRYRNMKGSVRLCGLDVTRDRAGLMSVIGIVSQTKRFFMEYDALENESMYSAYYPNWNSKVYGKVLRKLGLNPNIALKNYSTGEYIKYQIAFAAAYRPRILLMDEPTANLDPVFREDFLKLLQGFVADYETTILFATHISEDLSRVADYIVEIEEGNCRIRGIEV